MYDSIKGKVALVTGAARKRGIPRAIALRLAREGADVAVNDIISTTEALDVWDREEGWRGLESLAAEIKTLGRRSLAVPADVSNPGQVSAMVGKVVEKLGRIDILVNGAAVMERDIGRAAVVDRAVEIWNKSIAINLTGDFLTCQAVGKQMIKQGQGGKIVNISSRQGKMPQAENSPYGASKAGVINLTQALALEMAQYHIYVNAVCPGPILSWGSRGKDIYERMKRGMSEEAAIAEVYPPSDWSPLGRIGRVEDVVNLVVFLLSDQADWMTGQAINVSGGMMMMH